MSTQPTIIQIVDRIDPTIAAKINGISTAARAAAADVNSLQAALLSISGSSGLTALNSSLAKIAPASIAVSQGTGTLAKAIDTVSVAASGGEKNLLKLSKALALPPVTNVQLLSKSLETVVTPATVAADKVLSLSRTLADAPTKTVPALQTFLALSQGLGTLPNPAVSATEKLLTLSSALGTTNTSLNVAPGVRALSTALATLPTPTVSAAEKLASLSQSLATTPVGANVTTQSVRVLSQALGDLPVTSTAAEAGLLKLSKSLSTTPTNRIVQDVTTLSKSLGLIPAPSKASAQNVLELSRALSAGTASFTPANAAILSLSEGLGKIPVPATSVWQKLTQLAGGSSTLTGRLATLAGRVVGMEAGLGRLGGAFAGVGTAAAGAGPFLIAALAVGAVLGAIVLYEKFREEANALLETQTALAKQFNAVNDRILDQKEQLAGLTSGPLAKYAQELKDLPLKSIDNDFAGIQKELEQQHSWWKTIISDAEQFFAIDTQLTQFGGTTLPQAQAPIADIRDTERFLLEQEQLRQSGKSTQQVLKGDLDQITRDAKQAADAQSFDKKAALEREMVAINAKIALQRKAEIGQSDTTKSIIEVTIASLQRAYNDDLLHYQDYLGKKAVLTADAAKAAVAEQLKQFTEEMDRFKASVPGGVVSAQQELALRQQQLAGTARPTAIPGLDSRAALNGAEGGNVAKLTTDVQKLTAEINKQSFQVDNLVKRYQNAVFQTGAYSDALKVEAEYDKLVADVEAKRIPTIESLNKALSDGTIELDLYKKLAPAAQELAVRLEAVAKQGVEDAKVNRELVAIYNEFRGPIETYSSTVKATTELLKQNAITADQAAQANARAARAMQDSIDPLNEYKIGLQQETQLLGLYGESGKVAAQVDQLRFELQRDGRDLSQSSIDILTKYLTLQDEQRGIQEAVNQLWEDGAGAQLKLKEQQEALDIAQQKNIITLQQWKAASLDVALATNKLNNEITGGTLKSNIIQLYGGLITQLKGAHPVIHALQADFGQFFASLKKGFADSIAHVLVFGGSLKTALLDTARNAVAALISSLIELGIEFLIVTALSKAFGITLPKKDDGPQKQIEQMAIAVASIAVITATQLAAINVLLGPAWALAEAISLASFGANAPAAASGITSVVAAGTAAQTAGRFATGGLIQGKGTGTSDDILLRASHGEFVVNAKATAKNRDLLEAINHNDDLIRFRQTTIARFADGGMVGYTHPVFDYSTTHTGDLIAPSVRNTMQMKVNVVHDGSTGIQVEQIDAMTVRIIARQEAKSAVQEHGPRTIAADMYNPNSETSKAVTRNIDARRKR